MKCPKTTSITKMQIVMKKSLSISKASFIVTMSACAYQSGCPSILNKHNQ